MSSEKINKAVLNKDGSLSKSKLRHASLSVIQSVATSLGFGKKELIAFICQRNNSQKGGGFTYNEPSKTIEIIDETFKLEEFNVEKFTNDYKSAFTQPTTWESQDWKTPMSATERNILNSRYPTVSFKGFTFKIHIAHPKYDPVNTVIRLYTGIQNLHIINNTLYLFKLIPNDADMLTSINKTGLNSNNVVDKNKGAAGFVNTGVGETADSGKQYLSGSLNGAASYDEYIDNGNGTLLLVFKCDAQVAAQLVVNNGSHIYTSVVIDPKYIYVCDKDSYKSEAIPDAPNELDGPRKGLRSFAGTIHEEEKDGQNIIKLNEYGYTLEYGITPIGKYKLKKQGGAVNRNKRISH